MFLNKLVSCFFGILLAMPLLAQDGSLDLGFTASSSQYTRSVLQLSNGKVICTHALSTSGGIKYYNSDGSAFSFTFKTPPQQTGSNFIRDIIEQPDGKILFLNSNSSPKLYRYNTDGTLDSDFQTNIGTGVNFSCFKGEYEPDGKITIIGNFSTFNGVSKGGIVRLNPDGTIDNSFVATGTPSSVGITDIIRLPNGKYYITGPNISMFNGVAQLSSTIRLNADGTVDTSYQSEQGSNFERIGLLSDGSIIGGGSTLRKLTPDGKFTNFGPFANIGGNQVNLNMGNSQGTLVGLHVQSDDKIILSGNFNKYAGTTITNHFVRINSDGSIDNSFNVGTGPSHEVYCSELNTDGSILIGGFFWQYNGVARNYIARIKNSSLISNTTNHIEKTEFEVYPCPANEYVHIRGDFEGGSWIELLDMSGKVVFSKQMNVNNTQDSLLEIPTGVKGMYTLRISDASGTQRMKKISVY